ncbi:MAG: ferrous iron transport protein A [Fusobacteriaceae bacterium]|nr:ferrous iron transport protein A [Fusobacteriaceae bacterium]MBN2839162.1 ferrous iron transport protein A [Fusobacteriaceae bacterium]
MKLTELKKGEEAKIVKINKSGELKKRLSDIGVTSGESISFKRNAPLGDPQQYFIKGNNIALRKIDAENIIIEK